METRLLHKRENKPRTATLTVAEFFLSFSPSLSDAALARRTLPTPGLFCLSCAIYIAQKLNLKSSLNFLLIIASQASQRLRFLPSGYCDFIHGAGNREIQYVNSLPQGYGFVIRLKYL